MDSDDLLWRGLRFNGQKYIAVINFNVNHECANDVKSSP